MKTIAVLFFAFLATIPTSAQIPTVRPEPAATSYDTSELNLLPQYNRSTFKAAFGQDAPAFDISRPPKTWFDSTQACLRPANSNYQVLAGFNLALLTIPSCDAASVNLLPDVQPQFPPVLVVKDSGVRYTGVMDLDTYLQVAVNRIETSAMPPISVAAIDASKLAAELPGDAQFLCTWQNLNDPHFHGGIDPACANQSSVVAKYTDILKSWGTEAAALQDLMGTVPGTPCKFCDAIAKPAVAMPVRPLYPDEKISIASMMGGMVVLRIPPAQPIPAQGGNFTDADRHALLQILQILKSITGN
jgi:hypothetical protein